LRTKLTNVSARILFYSVSRPKSKPSFCFNDGVVSRLPVLVNQLLTSETFLCPFPHQALNEPCTNERSASLMHNPVPLKQQGQTALRGAQHPSRTPGARQTPTPSPGPARSRATGSSSGVLSAGIRGGRILLERMGGLWRLGLRVFLNAAYLEAKWGENMENSLGCLGKC